MTRNELLKILREIQRGRLNPEDALELIRHLPYEDLSIAKIDHHRTILSGIPEVILAKDKRPDEVVLIARRMYERHGRFLITKAGEEVYKKLRIKEARFYERSGTIVAGSLSEKGSKKILIITAGTSDAAVAEEAQVTAEFLGHPVEVIQDVGIAGLHRIVSHMEKFKEAGAIIVIAGMEGALPSVVAALTDRPVIGVPTSSGYGMSLGGVAALLGMLNSCVPGVAVMNINNGFGAACLAHRINSVALTRPRDKQ